MKSYMQGNLVLRRLAGALYVAVSVWGREQQNQSTKAHGVSKLQRLAMSAESFYVHKQRDGKVEVAGKCGTRKQCYLHLNVQH